MKTVILLFIISIVNHSINCKNIPEGYYHNTSGVVTYWPTNNANTKTEETSTKNTTTEPGWLRAQLLKFGQVASKIGNTMGRHSNKITLALDKICEVIKTVIPLLAAVCHVGQFGFCSAADDAPLKLSEAMNPNDLNLDSLDRR